MVAPEGNHPLPALLTFPSYIRNIIPPASALTQSLMAKLLSATEMFPVTHTDFMYDWSVAPNPVDL